jgi:5-methylcytosine-specific restriction endonuclease McrA
VIDLSGSCGYIRTGERGVCRAFLSLTFPPMEPTDMADDDLPQIVTQAQARASGLSRYFTGRACKAGHVAERYVSSGGCVPCAVSFAASWRSANPERYNQNAAAWRAANPHSVKEASARWRANHPERAKAVRLASVLANADRARQLDKARRSRPDVIEKTRAASRRYRKAHLEKVRERNAAYDKAHPEEKRARNRVRRARKKGAGGSHTGADIRWLLGKQRRCCAHSWCRKSLSRSYHVDHILPVALGGSNDRKNLQLLCAPCNYEKTSKHPVEFAQKHGLLL